MITRGYIVKLADQIDNKYGVRIPSFEQPGINSSESMSIIEALYCSTPGDFHSLKVGDCVFVGFENNEYTDAVILGKLYTGVLDDSGSGYSCKESLKVSGSAILPLDTKIGNLNFLKLQENISELNDVKSWVENYVAGHGGGGGSSIKNLEDGEGGRSLQQKLEVPKFTFNNPNSDKHGEEITAGATGNCSSSFGSKTSSQGKRAVAFNTQCVASGNYSMSQGDNCESSGGASHAEGVQTLSPGYSAHSEGNLTIAEGDQSHAEGGLTHSIGQYSHSEGQETVSEGIASHAEGSNSKTHANVSHAEGESNEVFADASHAEGTLNRIINEKEQEPPFMLAGTWLFNTSFNSKDVTLTIGDSDELKVKLVNNEIYKIMQIQDNGTLAFFKENWASPIAFYKNFVGQEDFRTIYFEEPYNCQNNIGFYNWFIQNAYYQGDVPPEFDFDENAGKSSHAEGISNEVLGYASHAEGSNNKVYAPFAHAEGEGCQAGNYRIVDGEYKYLSGRGSHAEGINTKALGHYSHTSGRGTIASYDNQFVIGKFNNNKSTTLFEVGNGDRESIPSNAFEVYTDGTLGITNFDSMGNRIGTKRLRCVNGVLTVID